MYVGRDFSPQENGESEVYGLDFVYDLEHDEQLLSSKWTIHVTHGFDPTPQVHLEGTSKVVVPFGSNLKTASIQRIGGLWHDVTYAVRAIVITDQGNTRNLWSHIRGVNIGAD
jgi:hypothetical protein